MEVFRYLPWRNEILHGMLGADLIGFHTYDYSRHFLSCVLRLLGFEYNYNQIITGSRIITVDTFPMGIDAAKFAAAVDSPAVKSELENLQSSLKSARMILSVDRLDFTKGIPERLRAYEIFLEKYPQWHGKIIYFMLCVPSRDKIHQYQLLKKRWMNRDFLSKWLGDTGASLVAEHGTWIKPEFRKCDIESASACKTSSINVQNLQMEIVI